MVKCIEFRISPGHAQPFGATVKPGGINFSIFSRHAEHVSLVLFRPDESHKCAEIQLDPDVHKTGDIWHVMVHDVDEHIRYGYRMSGSYDPEGTGHCFNSDIILIDPYTKVLTAGNQWGEALERPGRKTPESKYFHRCIPYEDFFDWEGDRPLNIPLQDTIIYELHVRGYTMDPSSGVNYPGTYKGIIEKIPYLKELGITAVELMPVAEFNENENINRNPETGERLKNFWGYSPLAFFAPKAAYAANGKNGNQVDEFKEMVKALHKAGIEVILDVVFNHTGEGGSNGPVMSFRGIDNTIYYMLEPQTKEPFNFSGCGNTVNCNHPVVRNFIIDCLHYWVTEMHVDGFRFDLASILGRDQKGNVLENPPVVESIAEDPVLSNTKIIAEAWDAAGVYQVGHFSRSIRWAEWNGKFRDDVRAFLCGKEGTVTSLATRIAGSSDLYQKSLRHPFNSINFMTSHDGFTLYDLVSYNHKHNLANGEDNRDGSDHEISWNSGVEGDTANPRIKALRARRMRTFAVILFLSQGVPMFNSGDEFARTQQGNNNPYCQDNPLGWMDWKLARENASLLRFFKLLIALRKSHPVFRRKDFFAGENEKGFPEIIWQSTQPGHTDWSEKCLTLGFFLDGRGVNGEPDDDFFIMLNGNLQQKQFTMPRPHGSAWRKLVDTGAHAPDDVFEEANGPIVTGNRIMVTGMAAVVLISKRNLNP